MKWALIVVVVALTWAAPASATCVKTTGNPGDTNYFQAGSCELGNLTVVVESEQTAAASCPGPLNRSFPLNTSGSPVRFGWRNGTAKLTVDGAKTHPCGGGYWTFLALMDHRDHGGSPTWPPRQDFTLAYSQTSPGEHDGTRLIVGIQVWYGGMAHILEVNLAQANWAPWPDMAPGVILVSRDWYGDGEAEYVALTGSYWGLRVKPGVTTNVRIPWRRLIREAVAQGWFRSRAGFPVVTQAVYVAVEARSRGSARVVWQAADGAARRERW